MSKLVIGYFDDNVKAVPNQGEGEMSVLGRANVINVPIWLELDELVTQPRIDMFWYMPELPHKMAWHGKGAGEFANVSFTHAEKEKTRTLLAAQWGSDTVLYPGTSNYLGHVAMVFTRGQFLPRDGELRYRVFSEIGNKFPLFDGAIRFMCEYKVSM